MNKQICEKCKGTGKIYKMPDYLNASDQIIEFICDKCFGEGSYYINMEV